MTDTAQRAVELAVAAAGVKDDQWLRRVYGNIAEIAVLLSDNSDAHHWAERIDQAARYKVTFTGFEEEIPQGRTRPTRLIINTQSDSAIKNNPGKSDHNPEGHEHFRTDPLWTKPGKIVADRIRHLPVGAEILVYKHTESVDESKKVRVLVHFEVLRSPSAGVAARPPADRQGQDSRPPTAAPGPAPAETPAPPPEPHSPDDNAALTEIEARFEALTARQRVAYGHLCKETGIANPMCPEPDQMATALGFFDKLEADHAAS